MAASGSRQHDVSVHFSRQRDSGSRNLPRGVETEQRTTASTVASACKANVVTEELDGVDVDECRW